LARQINLVNPALRKTQDRLSAIPVAGVAAALLLLVVLAAVWVNVSAADAHREAEEWTANRKQAQDALLAATQAVAARRPDARLVAELDSARALVQRQGEVLAVLDSKAVGDTGGFSEYLRGFARQVPQGLWLTGFAIGAGGRDMELRGRMVAPSLLPEYVKRLNAESAFRGHTFASLQIQAPPVVAATAAAASPAYSEFVLTSVAAEERR
jgi:hypothetical protein